MMQTRFTLILFFSMVTYKAACHAPVLSMALLVGGIFFTQNSKIEDQSCGAPWL